MSEPCFFDGPGVAGLLQGPVDGLPVVALHGWLDNAGSFARLLPCLQAPRILALDLPGHGLSRHRGAAADYALWRYLPDILAVADAMGWRRFAIIGHSLGASIALLLAASLPERVSGLALIDGLIPYADDPAQAPAKLRNALLAEQRLMHKAPPLYPDVEAALQARTRSGEVSVEGARYLLERGLRIQPEGVAWCTDQRLTLPSPVRLTDAHVQALLDAVSCPVRLVIAEQGLLAQIPDFEARFCREAFEVVRQPGGHHLHLDTEAGAQSIADCFRPFLQCIAAMEAG